jgi:hypothetical protein
MWNMDAYAYVYACIYFVKYAFLFGFDVIVVVYCLFMHVEY